MVNQFRVTIKFACIGLCLILLISNGAAAQHEFILKEYDEFHYVLHPLEHEALPQKDFRRIRSKASELVRLGKVIVKLKLPPAPEASQKNFQAERKKFQIALRRFERDARSGSDEQLKKSYSQVHDSFETLASLLRALYPLGMPPLVSVNCPSGKVEEGSQIKVSAITEAERPVFAWRLTAGKLTEGDNTSSILIDTTGLAGQNITVTVEVNDRFEFTVVATCKLHIAAGKPKH